MHFALHNRLVYNSIAAWRQCRVNAAISVRCSEMPLVGGCSHTSTVNTFYLSTHVKYLLTSHVTKSLRDLVCG